MCPLTRFSKLNVGQPVNFELQIKNNYFLSINVPHKHVKFFYYYNHLRRLSSQETSRESRKRSGQKKTNQHHLTNKKLQVIGKLF